MNVISWHISLLNMLVYTGTKNQNLSVHCPLQIWKYFLNIFAYPVKKQSGPNTRCEFGQRYKHSEFYKDHSRVIQDIRYGPGSRHLEWFQMV